MQPKSHRKMDADSFGRFAREMRATLDIGRHIAGEPSYATPLPLEVGFQLTNRCNLRCATCFQWNETGFHNAFAPSVQRAELDIAVVQRVLEETRSVRSSVYLWGGEPLVYRKWNELASLLAADRRRVVLCTNGIALPSKLDTIIPISKDFVCLISVDGFREENDALRGKNTFRVATGAIEQLVELKRAGQYLGDVGVSCVINAPLIPRLLEFVEHFQAVGVDAIYMVFPWYIPKATADRMDDYFDVNLGSLREQHPELLSNHVNSWHSYDFHILPEAVGELRCQMKQIFDTVWEPRVRFQPELGLDEIEAFARGSEQPAQRRTRCLSVARRLNVMPDGSVTTCKLFPEFQVGNLTGKSVAEVWHGVVAAQTRRKLAEGLMPICSKCVQLYLHSA